MGTLSRSASLMRRYVSRLLTDTATLSGTVNGTWQQVATGVPCRVDTISARVGYGASRAMSTAGLPAVATAAGAMGWIALDQAVWPGMQIDIDGGRSWWLTVIGTEETDAAVHELLLIDATDRVAVTLSRAADDGSVTDLAPQDVLIAGLESATTPDAKTANLPNPSSGQLFRPTPFDAKAGDRVALPGGWQATLTAPAKVLGGFAVADVHFDGWFG